MKTLLVLSSLLFALASCGQSASEADVLAKTKLLEKTVFGTKDSATLVPLLGSTLVYIHSSGKTETREEAIQGIIHNKSVYTPEPTGFNYDVKSYTDSVVVKHPFRAEERKADGTEGKVNIVISLQWRQEDGVWKLFRRQAIKAQ